MSSIVKIEHLSHKYSSSWAIRDINIEINHSGIVGLLGSNGAGKSTTMNILCGALNQTEGNVYINGTDVREEPELAKRDIGFLPQTPPLYMDLTVDEYLVYCAALRKMEKNTVRPAIEEAKQRCGVAHFSNRLLRNLSGGYRQRVGIAQAIMHRPKLVVLDEPTNGLDPVGIAEIRELIIELCKSGHTIIIASHLLDEVERVCTHVAILKTGELLTTGEVNEVMQDEDVVEVSAANLNLLAEILRPFSKNLHVNNNSNTIQFTLPKGTAKLEDINSLCFDKGIVLNHLLLKKKRLETRFFELTNN